MADITFSQRVVNAVNSAFTILGLGETSSTAYRGDRGKTAYDHSQITSGNPHGTVTGDLTESSDKKFVTDSQKTLLDNGVQAISEKGQPDGYANLNSSGLVPSSQLPTHIDDVQEFSDLASFPVTGLTGIIYVDLSTNLTYRWSGSIYVKLTDGGVNSFNSRTGAVLPQSGDYNLDQISETLTSVLVSPTEKTTWNGKQNNLGFAPLSVTNNLSDLDDAGVAKGNLSLENVNNTSDLNKPISTATQTALDLKVDKADVMQSIRTISTNETITAGYSGIVVRKFRINSGVKLIINTGSTFRIL